MKPLEMNVLQVRKLLVGFIREHTQKQGFSRIILGLSGGVDSSVAAYLAVEALGNKNCLGVLLPHRVSSPQSTADAQQVAECLRMPIQMVDISPMVDAFQQALPDITAVQLGNVMARCRMIVLYHLSAQKQALVMGTSNKSEILLGYGTLYGDLACAFNPLGDLYKTQIRLLAENLGVPEAIRQKMPSADLWAGQSDEGDLGVTYAEVDRFLVRWVDHRLNHQELIAEGFTPDYIDRVVKLVQSQHFKRTPPVIPKIS
ncbi:MAG: NAD+ synthase [bacterium]